MSKVSKEQAAATRERILDEAAQSFRERGFGGISVADLMNSVWTHPRWLLWALQFEGGPDGEGVPARRQLHARGLEPLGQRAAGKPLEALVTYYLSGEHRDRRSHRMPHGGPRAGSIAPATPVRRAVMESLHSVLGFLMRLVPGKSAAARRDKTIVLFATLVGALVAARAVDDPQMSEEILETVLRATAARRL